MSRSLNAWIPNWPIRQFYLCIPLKTDYCRWQKNGGIQFPQHVEILTTYGYGASYTSGDNPRIIFRMSRFSPDRIVGLLQHEFIHILIEQPIIEKYKVPQDLKERIVDIIGFEYFGIPVQKRFETSFANPYITKEGIENDLPGSVQRLMNDYTLFQAKMHQRFGKSLG